LLYINVRSVCGAPPWPLIQRVLHRIGGMVGTVLRSSLVVKDQLVARIASSILRALRGLMPSSILRALCGLRAGFARTNQAVADSCIPQRRTLLQRGCENLGWIITTISDSAHADPSGLFFCPLRDSSENYASVVYSCRFKSVVKTSLS
jgi:hypothetical protein